MQHWLQLATRNWRAKPGRTLAVLLAAALGVGTVVAVTSIYAAVERSIGEQIVDNWVGRSHLTIASPSGHWGHVDAALIPEVARLEGVTRLTARFKTRMHLRVPEHVHNLPPDTYTGLSGRIEIDVVGVDPSREYEFRDLRGLTGRVLQPDDRAVALLDKGLAGDLGLNIGDTVDIEPYLDEPASAVRIVGLYDSRRVAIFQRPTVQLPLSFVQEMRRETGKVSAIDCMVSDPQPDRLETFATRLRDMLRSRGQGYEVSTAAAKLNQLQQAQRASRLILSLFGCVALLTSFFIILTTQSSGLIERIRQLGTMRCVGLTRGQLAGLVVLEIVPAGVLGALAGWPLGLGLTRVAMSHLARAELLVDDVTTSGWGLALALLGGLATILAAAGALIWQAARVSPLVAANPEARAGRRSIVAITALAGLLLLGLHQVMVFRLPPLQWIRPLVAFVGMISLYGGYVLLAPGTVCVLGQAAVQVAAPLLRVNRKLAADQVGRAPWRAAGVCWMLMVGLSLIVYFAVRGESITHAWDFPSKIAGVFVWSPEPFSRSLSAEVTRIPGVKDVTPIREVWAKVQPRHSSLLSLIKSQSAFVAGDPDTFLGMSELEFLEGNLAEARTKLAAGGHVLLPQEAAHSFGYHLGDKVPVNLAGKTVEFEVAGVVRSPAIDIAVTWFQADSYMALAAGGSVLGTIDDLESRFGVHDVTMFLLNIELAPCTVPMPVEFAAADAPPVESRWLAGRLPGWLPALPGEDEVVAEHLAAIQAVAAGPQRVLAKGPARELRRYLEALGSVARQWRELDPPARWEVFREQLVLGRIKQVLDRPAAMTGSLRRLKQEIDRDIRRATLLVSAIPTISLVVATLGVGNLMMVSVAARARQIAVLRAVGATKSQVARLVLVEAVVVGLLGSVIGVLLGLHAAHSTGYLASHLLGLNIPYVVPWGRVLAGVGLTWLVCLLAGIGPALRAARSNIIAALQVA